VTPQTLWRGLVEGDWSIVDRYDLAGRSYLVARKNAPSVAKLRALTEQEREILTCAASGQSNKQIGYEVGLSIGSISSHVMSALRKMGLRSRAELVVLMPLDELTSKPSA
jgi:DNA-binding NarL/FixJ family response regulator